MARTCIALFKLNHPAKNLLILCNEVVARASVLGSDLTGHTYPDYGYTRNVMYQSGAGTWGAGGVNTTANTITLSQPWSGPELKAGSAVANHFFGSNYNCVSSGAVPNAWTQYQATIAGVAVNGDLTATKFRAGTAYVKPMMLTNYHGQTNNLIRWRDVEWTYGQNIGFHAADAVELHINDLASFSTGVTY